MRTPLQVLADELSVRYTMEEDEARRLALTAIEALHGKYISMSFITRARVDFVKAQREDL